MNENTKGVLLLSSGSKVAITRAAVKSATGRGLALHGSDRSENVPTCHFVDRFTCMDTSSGDRWVEDVRAYCQANAIGLIIPTRESDLEPLAKLKSSFASEGIAIAISDWETISLCSDKLATETFFKRVKAPTPKTITLKECRERENELDFPLIAKPRYGSASKGVQKIHEADELKSLSEDYLLQEQAPGHEYTINTYVSLFGECICTIPHRRILVDGSESVQARTEKIPTLMEWGKRISESLPGASGPLNIQCFFDANSNTIQFIEINPRLGGGFPIANAAKGNFVEWIFQEVFEKRRLDTFQNWTDKLMMMKYRDAIFEVD